MKKRFKFNERKGVDGFVELEISDNVSSQTHFDFLRGCIIDKQDWAVSGYALSLEEIKTTITAFSWLLKKIDKAKGERK